MQGVRGYACLAGLAAIALLGAVAGASPAGAAKVRFTIAKQKDGPYQVHEPGKGALHVNVDDPRSLYVKALNKARSRKTVRLFEEACCAPNMDDYSLDWFKGDQDITHDVQTSGHEFKLKPDRARRFRVRVKPETVTPGSFCLFPYVEFGSNTAQSYFAINSKTACF